MRDHFSLDAQRVLHERALALAQKPRTAPEASTQLEILEFRLARERYAVETRHVQEVHPLKALTLLPGTPSFLPGIVNVRSRILPVLDLKKFFGLPELGLTDLHCIILVKGNDLEFGLLADVVTIVRTIAADSLQSTLPTLTGIRADYLKGVTEERLIVLDLDRVLSDPRIILHQEATHETPS